MRLVAIVHVRGNIWFNQVTFIHSASHRGFPMGSTSKSQVYFNIHHCTLHKKSLHGPLGLKACALVKGDDRRVDLTSMFRKHRESIQTHTHTHKKKLLQILFSQEKRRQRFKYTATAESKLIVNDGNKIKIKLWDTLFSLLNIDRPALFCICGRHTENDFNIISIVQ